MADDRVGQIGENHNIEFSAPNPTDVQANISAVKIDNKLQSVRRKSKTELSEEQV